MDGILLLGHCGMQAHRRRRSEIQRTEERLCNFVMNIFEEDEVSKDRIGGEVHAVNATKGVYRDDLTGQVLEPALVQAARRKELEYFNDKGVWEKCHRAECLAATVSTREMMTHPTKEADSWRARYVGRERTRCLRPRHRLRV